MWVQERGREKMDTRAGKGGIPKAAGKGSCQQQLKEGGIFHTTQQACCAHAMRAVASLPSSAAILAALACAGCWAAAGAEGATGGWAAGEAAALGGVGPRDTGPSAYGCEP